MGAAPFSIRGRHGAVKEYLEEKKPDDDEGYGEGFSSPAKVRKEQEKDNRTGQQTVGAIDTVLDLERNELEFSSKAEREREEIEKVLFQKGQRDEGKRDEKTYVLHVQPKNIALQVGAGRQTELIEYHVAEHDNRQHYVCHFAQAGW
jgi:hypothetical protein